MQQAYPNITIISAEPEQTVAEQDAEHGPRLYEREPNHCWHRRKGVPLRNTLANYSGWVTGVRRADAPPRADTPLATGAEPHGPVQGNATAGGPDEDFHHYITAYGILQTPLVSEGYLSIGCAPCTTRVAPGDDPRSGRWAGSSKTECGLHG